MPEWAVWVEKTVDGIVCVDADDSESAKEKAREKIRKGNCSFDGEVRREIKRGVPPSEV